MNGLIEAEGQHEAAIQLLEELKHKSSSADAKNELARKLRSSANDAKKYGTRHCYKAYLGICLRLLCSVFLYKIASVGAWPLENAT